MLTRSEVWIDKTELSPSKLADFRSGLVKEGYQCRETEYQVYFVKMSATVIEEGEREDDISNRKQTRQCV